MRQFVVIGHDAPVEASFSLDDLAGGAGRLDVLCRCVNSALFLSHDVRRDTRIHLVLGDEVTVHVDGGDLRYMNPDERNIAALVRTALEKREEAIGHMPAESTPGITLTKRGFDAVLDAVARESTVVHLHEDGTPVADLDPPSNPAFVLSDHRDFADAEADRLAETATHRVRLGPRRLHADHAVTVAHNYLDTGGFARY